MQAEVPPYRVYSRKIAFDPALAAVAFKELYGTEACAFWLDSSRAETGLSRFSYMGGSPGPLSALVTFDQRAGEVTIVQSGTRTVVKADLYTWLSAELQHRRCSSEDLPFDFNCGFIGYFGYELKASSGASHKHDSRQPDAAFLFADRIVAIDHEKSEAWLVNYGTSEDAAAWMDDTARVLTQLPSGLAESPHRPWALSLRLERTEEQYRKDIGRCREFIYDGESYEICLTNRIFAPAVPEPLSLYFKLRQTDPAPHAAFLRFSEFSILSCSPECFLRIGRDGIAESKPIKGTRPRGRTCDEDDALRRDLGSSEKDRSENLMIVDLVRNDLGVVCEFGSVEVPRLMDVETYGTVHQLVSTVRGRLRQGMDAIDCVRAAFPGGSMTGAPKVRTMNLLDNLEHSARGIYSGSIGFLGLNGTADLNIVIRSLVCSAEETVIGVGGAIVALSDPAAEFEETLVKARAMVHALILDARGSAGADAVDDALAELRQSGCSARPTTSPLTVRKSPSAQN